MGKETFTFGDIEIEKKIKTCHRQKFYFLKYVDIEKVLVSNKIYFGLKNYEYCIGYLCNDHKVKPLHIMLPKTSTYVKNYDGETKWMYFLIEDDHLLKRYNEIKSAVIWEYKRIFPFKAQSAVIQKCRKNIF